MTDLSKPPTPETPAPQSGFDFNYPTIISLLYLNSFVLGITGLVLVCSVLSLVRAQKHEAMPNPATWLA
jgi:hypothetical protein